MKTNKVAMLVIAILGIALGVYIGFQIISLYPIAGSLQITTGLLGIVLIVGSFLYYFWWGFTLKS